MGLTMLNKIFTFYDTNTGSYIKKPFFTRKHVNVKILLILLVLSWFIFTFLKQKILPIGDIYSYIVVILMYG